MRLRKEKNENQKRRGVRNEKGEDGERERQYSSVDRRTGRGVWQSKGGGKGARQERMYTLCSFFLLASIFDFSRSKKETIEKMEVKKLRREKKGKKARGETD